MKATEREAMVAGCAEGWVDVAAMEGEVKRDACRAYATNPVVARVAGVVQGAIRKDPPATDKEQWTQLVTALQVEGYNNR